MGVGTGRRVRAVFFDAGNTLLAMDYAAIAAALAARGVAVTPGAVRAAEWRARVRLDDEVFVPARAFSTESRVTGARYLGLVLEELGVRDAATGEALAAWQRTYNAPVGLWHRADPDAAPALGLLRQAGLRAGVVSNSNGTARAALEAAGLAAHLDFVLDSHVVGVEKPDPRIFALALRAAGVEPAEAVHVGDLYSVDVRGAREAGLGAVLLDPGGHWGARDCPRAAGLLEAVRLALAGAA